MTAASGADQPTLRDQLAERACGVLVAAADITPRDLNIEAHAIVDALLPVIETREAALRDMLATAHRQIDTHRQAADEHQARVERAKAEAAADELDRLADDADLDPDDPVQQSWQLRARAASLRANQGGDVR